MNLFENSWLFHADHGYVLLNNKAKHAGTCDLLLDYGTQADAPQGRRAEGLGGHSHQYHDQSSFPQQHFVYDSGAVFYGKRSFSVTTVLRARAQLEGIWGIQGGWSKQIWLRLYLKLVAVVGFLIQILNNILNLL
jgi:hypothetical protein